MKRNILILMSLLISAAAFAKTEYVYTDHRFNYVKIDDLKGKEAKELKPTQPYSMTEEQMRAVLKDLKLSRTFIVKKEVEDQDVFTERAINFLAYKLVEALNRATDRQKVVFSYLSKEPIVILRNDRLTIGEVWVENGKMHIRFAKLYAKLMGDTDKKWDYEKIIGRAKGLRVELEVDPCQEYGRTREEIVIDTGCAAGDVAAAAAGTAAPAEEKPQAKKEAAPPAPTQVQAPMTTRDRLKELEQLKTDGLITESDYKRKKRDILKGL